MGMSAEDRAAKQRIDDLAARPLSEDLEGAYLPNRCAVGWCSRDPINHGSQHQGVIWGTIGTAPLGSYNMTLQAVQVGTFEDESTVGFTMIEGSPFMPQWSIVLEWGAIDRLVEALRKAVAEYDCDAPYQGPVWVAAGPAPPWRGSHNMTLRAVQTGVRDGSRVRFVISGNRPPAPDGSVQLEWTHRVEWTVVVEWADVDSLIAALQKVRAEWSPAQPSESM